MLPLASSPKYQTNAMDKGLNGWTDRLILIVYALTIRYMANHLGRIYARS